MPKAQQVHLTLSDKSKEYLYKIRDEYGLGSLSGAINWLIATDRLANYLKNNFQVDHNIYTAEKRNPTNIIPVTKEGKCQLSFCKYVGVVTKGIYKEHVYETDEDIKVELFMCPKHLKEQNA